jgi:hypothetical protein
MSGTSSFLKVKSSARAREQDHGFSFADLIDPVACQGDGTTRWPWAWDRLFPVAGRSVIVAQVVEVRQIRDRFREFWC